MPTFQIDTSAGTFEIDADREPTEAEVQQLIASGRLGKPEAPAAPSNDRYGDMSRGMMAGQPRDGVRGGAAAFDASAEVAAPTVAGMFNPVAGAIAGGLGETAVQVRRKLMGEQPNIKVGEILKAAAINSIPLAKAKGVIAALKNTGRLGAGGLAAEEARSLIDDGKLTSTGQGLAAGGIPAAVALAAPAVGKVASKFGAGLLDPADVQAMEKLAKQNKTRDATLAAIQDRGGKVVPTQVNQSVKNQLLEMAAGPTNVENGVSRENRPVFNAIAREEASIPADTAMGTKAFEDARAKIGAVYDDVRKLGLSDKLDQWREANNLTQDYYKELAGNFTVAGKKAAVDQENRASTLLGEIKADLIKQGRKDLADGLERSRVQFAKNYDVQDAVNVGSGDVETNVLKRKLEVKGDNGLTGGLGDIARFRASFPDSAKPVAGMTNSPSAVTAGTSLLAAGSGGSAATAVLKGGVPLMRTPIRNYITSAGYQRLNARPNYKVPVTSDPVLVELITRALVNKQRAGEGR